jgi:hypothetical protein
VILVYFIYYKKMSFFSSFYISEDMYNEKILSMLSLPGLFRPFL